MTNELEFPVSYRGPISGGDGTDSEMGSSDVADDVSDVVSEEGAEDVGSTDSVEGAVGTAVEKPDAEARKIQSAKDREIFQYQQQMNALMEMNAYMQSILDEAEAAAVPEDGRQLHLQTKALQRQAQTVQMKETMLMDIAKELSLRDMASKYGVEVDELRDFPNPATAINYCKKVEALKKSEKLAARAKSGADKLEGGGSSGKSLSNINDPLALLSMGYKRK